MLRSDFTANWHTHNFRCRHARGDFGDYAHAAIDAGITVQGVSDHCPTPDDRDIGVRMFHSDLLGYIDGFRASRDAEQGGGVGGRGGTTLCVSLEKDDRLPQPVPLIALRLGIW